MSINDLTIGEAKELVSIFGSSQKESTLTSMIGQKVIIRTYSAGVHFGTLSEKAGNEVILKNARRMYKWWAVKSISLSGVALYGTKHDKSKICPPLKSIWLEAIEIIECTEEAINSIEGAPNVEAR